MKDFFISYNQADRQWAEWIGWQLEEEGYTVIIQAWDMRPGSNFALEMQKAAVEAERTVAVLSPDYLNAVFTQTEWAAAFAVDPTGSLKKLVPVRVRDCKPQGMLNTIIYIDMVGLPEEEARQVLCSGIKKERVKPSQAPGFPGVAAVRTVAAHPGFPHIPAFMVSTSKLPVTGKDLFGREKELEILDKAWADPHTQMVTFVAWGGVGKSALVNYWLNLMEKKDYCGAKRVYGWSFYSQGAEAGKQASADEFMQTALAWFGDPDPSVGGAVEKARRLVELIRREPTLLVLDGLEPLQYPPGELHGFDGRMKDQGLKVLVKELAVSQPGLCVITTRETLADTADKVGHTVKEVGLEHLSDEAGAQLLRSLGVTGAEKELFQAVREYDGHALALTLLGNYLHSVFQGDIRKRDQVPGITQDRKMGWQARRMMAAYENWWGEAPEVNILRLLGLFDRPAEPGAIKALTSAPPIPGITEKLQGLSMEDWQWALNNLREAGLVAKVGAHKPGAKDPDSGPTSATSDSIGSIGPIRPISPIDTIDHIDSHPLIREYFAAKLREENPEGWKEAHTRLYHYYKSVPEKELPDTLVEMEPLFAAITHGCAAGLHQRALDEVYWPRIKRGDKHYIISKLGAFGADMAALSHFFQKPWSLPAAGLSEENKAGVLNRVATGLRALGRLPEAIQPFESSLKAYIENKNCKSAAITAGNLSELLLMLGRVKEAIDYARLSVVHADQSKDWSEKLLKRTALADALHQSGKVDEAEHLFREAEALQQERQPKYKYLYSLQGFQFCDLLLGQGHVQEVLERAKETLEWLIQDGDLLSIALDQLSLGRAWMMQVIKGKTRDFRTAETYLHQAVEGLRKAGTTDYLPRGLFARAAYYRVQQDYANAWQDLHEAFEIAELGSMKLYIADYHLEAGRLCRAEGKENDAAEHFRVAKALIEEMGYHRRDGEVER